MWELVEYQLQNTYAAMLNGNKELAFSVVKLGKKVNKFDVKIDRMSENLLALYTPVAIDLRLVLATLKINANLERIDDITESISKYIQHQNAPFSTEFLEQTKTCVMFEEAQAMFAACHQAYKTSDTTLARMVIKQDKTLNKIFRRSNDIFTTYLLRNPGSIQESLALLLII